MIPYNTNGTVWTFFVPSTGKAVRITSEDPRYDEVKKAVMKADEEKLIDLLNTPVEAYKINKVAKVATKCESFGNLKFIVDAAEDGTPQYKVTYKMRELPEVLGKYLYNLYEEGCKKFDHYFMFLDNILNNPSDRARNELYTFLASRHLPITDHGTFMAYKGVRSDMYSVNGNTKTRVLSGTVNKAGHILNKPGDTITVVTEDVDSDCNNYCSCGLHVGTWEYASGFGHTVVAVDVNPADVVSVPLDCGCEKCRVSSYKVLQIVTDQFTTTDVKVDGTSVEETKNTPIVSKDSVKKIINRIGYNKLKSTMKEYIAPRGEVTIRQLHGSVGKRFGIKSSDLFDIAVELDFTVKGADCVSRSTVKL